MHRRVYKLRGKETRDWWNTYIQETDEGTPLSWPQYTDQKWGPDLGGNRSTGLPLCKRAPHTEEWLATPTKLSLGSESEREKEGSWWWEPRWEGTQKSQEALEKRDKGKPGRSRSRCWRLGGEQGEDGGVGGSRRRRGRVTVAWKDSSTHVMRIQPWQPHGTQKLALQCLD